MVGMFSRAPEPGSPPFVRVGDVVAAGQTLCILEAMKLMNEVKSELEAVVRKIHVDNAQPVEFGQILFDLEPLAGPPTLKAGFSHPETCDRLSAVNGARVQSAQRSRGVSPAIRAIRSSSLGQT